MQSLHLLPRPLGNQGRCCPTFIKMPSKEKLKPSLTLCPLQPIANNNRIGKCLWYFRAQKLGKREQSGGHISICTQWHCRCFRNGLHVTPSLLFVVTCTGSDKWSPLKERPSKIWSQKEIRVNVFQLLLASGLGTFFIFTVLQFYFCCKFLICKYLVCYLCCGVSWAPVWLEKWGYISLLCRIHSPPALVSLILST